MPETEDIMKKVVMLILITVFALTGVAAATGLAPKGPGIGPVYRGHESSQNKFWERERVARALSLTEEEKEKLIELQKERRNAVQTMRKELTEQRQALREVILREDLSASEAKKRFLKAEEVRSRIHEQRFEMLLQEREILGSERFAKLLKMERRDMGKRRLRSGGR